MTTNHTPTMPISYRKSAPAVRSHVLYTADVPASWDIVVDGVVRGHVVGYAPQYGSGSYYRVEFDGVRLSRVGFARLADVKREVARVLAAKAQA